MCELSTVLTRAQGINRGSAGVLVQPDAGLSFAGSFVQIIEPDRSLAPPNWTGSPANRLSPFTSHPPLGRGG